MSENECAFCKLASGEYKSEIVHREEGKMAFHSISGKSLARMLVIPRNQVVSPQEIERLPGGAAKCVCVAQADYLFNANNGIVAGREGFRLHARTG